MSKILHLDDDPLMLVKTRNALSSTDFGAKWSYRSSKTEADFWKLFSEDTPDCVLLDIVVQNNSSAGLQVLQKLKSEKDFKKPVIMMSSVADVQLIKDCVKSGASDFVTKGMDEVEIAFRVSQALEIEASSRARARESIERFAGETMRAVYLKIPRILASSVKSVFVTGESGTGKEVVAEGFKSNLPAKTPFVPVNCAAIAKDLLESELFGHEKGAFTGAQTAKAGLFASADGGWIFLDEVARLTPSTQAALLRTLESGEIRPVGSSSSKIVQVRVLAATNEDLDDMVEKGEFRGDLLQRLRSYEVFLPPLRERGSEISEIIDSLVARLNAEAGETKNYRLAPAVRRLFLAHNWKKGNIRELWQVLQGSSVEAVDGLVTVNCLPKSFLDAVENPKETKSQQGLGVGADFEINFPVAYQDLEELFFLHVLGELSKKASHLLVSQRKVAETLGVSRHTLCAKLEKIAATQQLPEKFQHLVGNKKENDEQ